MRSSPFNRFHLLLLPVLCFISASESRGQAQHQVSAFQRVATNQVHITLTTPPDETYSFLQSSNLVDWLPAGPLPPVSYDGDSATYLLEIDPEQSVAAYQVAYEPVPPNPEPLASLEAPADEMVLQHLPVMGMPFENEADEVDVQNDVPISLAHILVTFKDTTSVQSLNDLLMSESLSLAGAELLMNLGLLRRNQITTLEDLNAQVERLAASGLFEAVALNIGLSPSRIIENPQPQLNSIGSEELELDWIWDTQSYRLGEGSGGNNAFEMSRIPQLWNWLDYGYRQKAFLGGHDVAVLDFAFYNHRDLDTNVVLGTTSNSALGDEEYDEGIGVVGVIAAKHNRAGTDGVTPLPDAVRGIPFPQNNSLAHFYSSVALRQLKSLLSGPNPPKVINMSVGISWGQIGDPTVVSRVPGTTYAEWMGGLGTLWATSISALNRNIPEADYLVVCSAGDDAGVDAAFNSPMANIACRSELLALAPQFLVVENVSEYREPNPDSNYDASGVGDSVSAGGTDVTLLAGPEALAYKTAASGTTLSAPFVSGLASFLWSLEPSLTISEMKHLLLSTNTTFDVQAGERANLVDGFSAALEIDNLRESPDLQRALVDVDDGTLDGNLRMGLMYFEKNPDQIHTADGRRGDGVVNMKDFRVFRDAWLHITGVTNNLDGPPTHFKRDLNFDGLVDNQPAYPPHPAPYKIGSRARPESGSQRVEWDYSRYDYNGNSVLDAETQGIDPTAFSAYISPFKVDPDTEVTEWNLSKGLVRDVDVLLDKDIWAQDEENVLLTGSYPSPSLYEMPPTDWSTNAMPTLFVTYLTSFDLHVDMEAGDPNSWDEGYLDHPVTPIHDGLWIDSYFSLTKARSDAWQGVLTIPFDTVFDFPAVAIQYKKTVGDEFHQYSFHFQPELGEDIALAVGFDELQFYSNTREFTASYLGDSNNPVSEETIAITPAGAPYGDFFVQPGEYDGNAVREQARLLAIALLSDRLKFPTALNGSPSYVAITNEKPENGGTRVEIYGITAMYDDIVGALISPSKAPGEKGKRAVRSDTSLDGI